MAGTTLPPKAPRAVPFFEIESTSRSVLRSDKQNLDAEDSDGGGAPHGVGLAAGMSGAGGAVAPPALSVCERDLTSPSQASRGTHGDDDEDASTPVAGFVIHRDDETSSVATTSLIRQFAQTNTAESAAKEDSFKKVNQQRQNVRGEAHRLASTTASATDIEFAEETTVHEDDDQMSTMFAVQPTEDGSVFGQSQIQRGMAADEEEDEDAAGAAVSHAQEAATRSSASESNVVQSSIQFATHTETEDGGGSSKYQQDQQQQLQRKASARHPVEHTTPWNSNTGKAPHHARYQPAKAADCEEAAYAEKHPMWTKPKGLLLAKLESGGGDSSLDRSSGNAAGARLERSSPAAAQPPAAAATGAAVSPKQSADFPYGQHGPRAKEFSEKLRREASEKSLVRSSSTSVREGPDMATAATAATTAAAAAPLNSSSPKRFAARGGSSPKEAAKRPSTERKASPNNTNNKPRVPPHQLKEQVEQWMKDHIPTGKTPRGKADAKPGDGEEADAASMSPGSSADPRASRNQGRSQQHDVAFRASERTRESSARRDSNADRGAVAPAHLDESPASGGLPGTPAARQHRYRIASPPTAPPPPQQQEMPLAERSRNHHDVDPLFEKLYRLGNKEAREEYIQEQLQREQTDLKLKRLVGLYGPSRGQREFDRLYGNAAEEGGAGGGAPSKRSATPPAWQRLYTTPPRRVPSVDPAAAKANMEKLRPATASGVRTASPADQKPSGGGASTARGLSPRPLTATDEDAQAKMVVYTRLYKQGLFDLQRKQKLAEETEAKRLQAERDEIERGKMMARALRHKSGHQQMTREEHEAFVGGKGSTVSPPRSTEPKLTEEQLQAIYTRLVKQGKKKTNQAMLDKTELRGCTFHPVVNPSPSRGRARHAASEQGHQQQLPQNVSEDSGSYPAASRQRSPSCDKACLKLYANAEKVKSGLSQLSDKVDRERRLKLLKARMNSDHHFLRRVQLDPSVAEAFMAALPCQV